MRWKFAAIKVKCGHYHTQPPVPVSDPKYLGEKEFFVFRIDFLFDIFDGETKVGTLPYQAIDVSVDLIGLDISTVDEVYEFLK